MYYVADVALVTPLRDGMNLVAKEYIAVKDGNPGVLILSEMAGAAVELSDALLINPNDMDQIEQAIVKALEMPEQEQLRRLKKMQRIVSAQTVNRWAESFINEWSSACRKNWAMNRKRLSPESETTIRRHYARARKRLILLDYDGTLAPIRARPEEASPTPELLDTLRLLCGDPRNRIVINSGRDKATLERWLGELPVTLAAEHGARYRENGVWHTRVARQQWNTGIMAILNLYLEKTPCSRLEVKDTALAWHYRECDPWLGELRAQQLTRALVSVCLRHKLQIIQGSKVLEIKSPEYSKGSEVRRLLEKGGYDFILAMGDDTTDDDMFEALPRDSFAVKVGSVSEKALYNMPQQERVLPFLRSLTEKVPDASEPSRKRPGRTAIRFVKRLLQTKNR